MKKKKTISVNGGDCFKCGKKNIEIVGLNIHQCTHNARYKEYMKKYSEIEEETTK